MNYQNDIQAQLIYTVAIIVLTSISILVVSKLTNIF